IDQFLSLIRLSVDRVLIEDLSSACRSLTCSQLPEESRLLARDNGLIAARLVKDMVNARHQVTALIHQASTRTPEHTTILECAHVDVVVVHPSRDGPEPSPRTTSSR